MTRQNNLKKNKTTPPPAIPQNNSFFSNIISTITQGFAFGSGSAIAHKTIDSITKSDDTVKSDYIKDQNIDCNQLLNLYTECIQKVQIEADISKCDQLINLYEKCTIKA